MPRWTEEQLSAIETSGSNIIVSAGAGSGKTAVLSTRVITKLKSGIHVNELLILTFTKAAAKEMKERIRKAIKKDESLQEELSLIDSSYITTFDSFSLSVVKKYHYLLNLSNNINITDSTLITMKKKEILEEIFNSYYEHSNPLFSKMINDFCIKDDKDIKKTILNIANKIELLPAKEEFINNYMSKYFDKQFINNLLKEYEQLIKEKIEEIKEELESYKHYFDYDFYLKTVASLSPILEEQDIERIIFSEVTLPRLTGSEEEQKNAKDKLKKKIDELYNFTKYGTLKEIEENIYLTKDTIEVILNIIKEYFEKLTEYKNKNEVYDFQDIAMLAIKLLKENEEVRNELKDTFKEIMIDEYQDTNDIQETFISYISNNNVYMVGDIKQSIYRFRNANPYIFKDKYDRYSLHNGGIKIDLLKNFRSRKEVLDNINLIFNYIMDDVIGGADYIKSHQMVFGNLSYIEKGSTDQDYNMEILEYELDKRYTKDEIEIFTIGRDILNKVNNKYKIYDKGTEEIHEAQFNDFVILMDRSTKFDLYKKIFEYLGIPLTIYKDEKITGSNDLYILKNIIDIVIHIASKNYDTNFKYDFISIARSYLYSIEDNEIFNYFINNNFEESKIFKDLSAISNNLNTKTVYMILEEIINKTNMYENLTKVPNIDNSIIRIQKLLEVADNLSALGYDIYKFNEYLKTLIEEEYDMKYQVSSADTNSVKIMTIHKSKGLEYNICYFSGLDKSFNLSDIKERFTFDNRYGIIVPLFKEGIRENIIKELLKKCYLEEEISEKIRLFYVAVTRAKEKMIFVEPKKEYIDVSKNDNGVISNLTRNKYRSFSDILLSIKKELKLYTSTINIDDLNISKDYLFSKETEFSNNESDKLIVKEINIENDLVENKSYSKKTHEVLSKEEQNNIKFGLEVHEVLENINLKNPDYALINNSFIERKIKAFLSSDITKNIQEANIYKEYEFMYESDNITHHGIIDLMLEYDKYIDIIDYKLSDITDENYINQLNGYKEYIKKISNKEVNVYLYSIIKEQVKRIN